MLDIIIKNGTIIDGTGKKPYKGDIGIKDGKIEFVSKDKRNDKHKDKNIDKHCNEHTAEKEIDAKGCVVCPGFIDYHSHSDISLIDANAKFANSLEQGITTEITGNCGGSVSPKTLEQVKAEYAQLKGQISEQEAAMLYQLVKDYKSYLGYLEKRPMGTNMAFYIGHGTIREAVMGYAARKPTDSELDAMKEHIRIAMEAGALGISSGLIYPPGSYSDEDELSELCKVVAEYGGSYTTHMRSEGNNLFRAVKEAINIGRRTGVSVNISHIKIAGKNNWGAYKELLELIDKANREGIKVTADMYPYRAGATTIRSAVPPMFARYGQAELVENMKKPEFRTQVKEEIYNSTVEFENLLEYSGFDGIMVLSAQDTALIGKTIAQIAAERGRDEFETFCDIVVESGGLAFCAFFLRDEKDIEKVFKHPLVMGGTDGAIESFIYPVFHPRHTGTFPKLIKDFVIDKKLVPMEEAIRRFTSLPAKTAGIDKYKGCIKDGYDADILILDIDKLNYTSDYFNPKGKNKGFNYVIVNGSIAVENDSFNGSHKGRLLRVR